MGPSMHLCLILTFIRLPTCAPHPGPHAYKLSEGRENILFISVFSRTNLVPAT